MISFKPLEKSDFPLLYKWLNIDFVTKWYAKRKFAYDDVEKKYSKYIEGAVPTESFIIEYQDVSIGYIQTYRLKDYPEYERCVGLVGDSAGLDMFIGDRNYIHKGLGKDIVNQFLKDVVFTKEDIDQCVVGPEPDNRSAIRVYEKAGFFYVKTVLCGKDNETEYIMMKKKKSRNEQVVYDRLKK